MAKNPNMDVVTLNLMDEVKRRKQEIAEIEHPVWRTNMSYRDNENNGNSAINLHVVSDVRQLLIIASTLACLEEYYKDTARIMEVNPVPDFKWCGFTTEDWMADIALRIKKIQIKAKKEELEDLETRLNAIISPELRTKLELEAIAAALK